MKIKFLKDSPDGKYKKGDDANITDHRANYWVKTGVAEKATDKPTKKKTAKKESKELKIDIETK